LRGRLNRAIDLCIGSAVSKATNIDLADWLVLRPHDADA
jgi:hypothetical protein